MLSESYSAVEKVQISTFLFVTKMFWLIKQKYFWQPEQIQMPAIKRLNLERVARCANQTICEGIAPCT